MMRGEQLSDQENALYEQVRGRGGVVDGEWFGCMNRWVDVGDGMMGGRLL